MYIGPNGQNANDCVLRNTFTGAFVMCKNAAFGIECKEGRTSYSF